MTYQLATEFCENQKYLDHRVEAVDFIPWWFPNRFISPNRMSQVSHLQYVSRSISFSTGVGHHLSFDFNNLTMSRRCVWLVTILSFHTVIYKQLLYIKYHPRNFARPSLWPPSWLLQQILKKNEIRGSIHKDGFPQQKKVNNLKKCKLAAYCLLDQKIDNYHVKSLFNGKMWSINSITQYARKRETSTTERNSKCFS